MNNLLKLKDIIHDLTYAEMMQFAKWFASTETTGEAVDEASFWAYVIHDWADNGEIPGEEDAA